MNTIHWYDWITPTNPFAALVLGLIILVVMTAGVWLETKERKTTMIVFGTGSITGIMVAFILNAVGFYG